MSVPFLLLPSLPSPPLPSAARPRGRGGGKGSAGETGRNSPARRRFPSAPSPRDPPRSGFGDGAEAAAPAPGGDGSVGGATAADRWAGTGCLGLHRGLGAARRLPAGPGSPQRGGSRGPAPGRRLRGLGSSQVRKRKRRRQNKGETGRPPAVPSLEPGGCSSLK